MVRDILHGILTEKSSAIDVALIKKILRQHRFKMKLSLKVCAHCALCAESCFLYMSRNKDPIYMPAHKFINTTGLLYKRRGVVDRSCLEEIREIAWKRCVLCMRCYCPLGIDIPDMIALARQVCRSQGILPRFDEEQLDKAGSQQLGTKGCR